jgi:hypothetical protein
MPVRVFLYPGKRACGRERMEQALAWAYSAGKFNESAGFREAEFTPDELGEITRAFYAGLENIDEPTGRLHFVRTPGAA